MDNPIYARQDQEPNTWYQRFLIYRDLPANKRELVTAFRIHQDIVAQDKPCKSYKQAPGAWNDAFRKWNWLARAQTFDDDRQKKQDELEEARRQEVLNTGLATIEGRVQALKDKATLIDKSFLNEKGEIEFKWVSAEKLREYRGFLEDIASELGHRVKRKEITGKDGVPLVPQRNSDLSLLNEEELTTLEGMLQAAKERAK